VAPPARRAVLLAKVGLPEQAVPLARRVARWRDRRKRWSDRRKRWEQLAAQPASPGRAERAAQSTPGQPRDGGGATTRRERGFSFFIVSQAAMIALSGNAKGFGGDFRYGEADGITGADKILSGYGGAQHARQWENVARLFECHQRSRRSGSERCRPHW
jgi:hypothetical protein